MAIHHFPNSLNHTDHHHHHHDHHGNYNFSSSDFSLLSNPLFSTILTLYLLILLYFPHFFLTLFLSPLFISTLILLLSLLRCGVSHHTRASTDLNRVVTRPDSEPVETEVAQVGSHCKETQSTPEPEPEPKHHIIEAGRCSSTRPESDPNPNPFCGEWGVGAPLEVIYEAYEGEEEGDEDQNDASSKENCAVRMIARTYPSLDRYYPESDMDSDSDSDSGSSLSWWNEEEEEREGLIEIDLDYDHGDHHHKERRKPLEYLGQADEEDNLIEIDISPNPITANYGFSW